MELKARQGDSIGRGSVHGKLSTHHIPTCNTPRSHSTSRNPESSAAPALFRHDQSSSHGDWTMLHKRTRNTVSRSEHHSKLPPSHLSVRLKLVTPSDGRLQTHYEKQYGITGHAHGDAMLHRRPYRVCPNAQQLAKYIRSHPSFFFFSPNFQGGDATLGYPCCRVSTTA
jgi:hypothetical protein